MNTSFLLITHPGIGIAIKHQTQILMGVLRFKCHCIEVGTDSDPDQSLRQIETYLTQEDDHQWLIITDIYGATPSNLGVSMGKKHAIPVLHGLNLPMLMRANNYAELDTQTLAQKMLEGGKQAIFVNQPND